MLSPRHSNSSTSPIASRAKSRPWRLQWRSETIPIFKASTLLRRVAIEERNHAHALYLHMLGSAPLVHDLHAGQQAGEFVAGGRRMRNIRPRQQHCRYRTMAREIPIHAEHEIAAPHVL